MSSYIYIPVSEIAKPRFEFGHTENLPLQGLELSTNYRQISTKIGCDYIEGVMLGHNQVMYVDENGRMNGLPFNPLASVVYNRFRGGDMVVGDAIIMAYDNEGENADVSQTMLITVSKMATAMMTEGTLNELA